MEWRLPRPLLGSHPLIAEAKRRAQRRRLFVALTLAALVCGAVAVTMALRSPTGSSSSFVKKISNPAYASASDCGTAVPGEGFQVFACMSGGARAGHPHPKELLVLRSDGSSVAYPAFRLGEFAVGHGEVVATYDVNLVRVTSSRLVPLLPTRQLARALHIRSTAIMDIYDPRLDAHGDIYFMASIVARSGCQNRVLERTSAGTTHQVRAAMTSRTHTCA